jgi:hypothetical protein
LERERVVERGLNFQRVTSDEKLIFYGSEKGCNKSKISIFDQDLQLQLTFEAGVEIRSLAVDQQSCYVLGKRREREAGRYFVEKRHKTGKNFLFYFHCKGKFILIRSTDSSGRFI